MLDSPTTRFLISCASIVIIIAGVKIAQPIIVPVLIAFFLALLTNPGVALLRRLRVPLGLSITLMVGLVFTFFYGVGSIVAASSGDFINNFPTYTVQVEKWLTTLRESAPWITNDVQQYIEELRPTERLLSFAGTLFSSIGSFLTAIVLVLFTLIFSLYEAQSAAKKVTFALGDDLTINYVKRFSKLVQRYLLIKTLISIATGLIVGIFLWLLGVDYPVIWGTLAFLMNFVPNIGSMLAAIPPVLLASIQLGLPGFLISLTGFVGINMVIGNFIEPKLMGRTLDISPLIVFLSLVFWGWILGPVGMLLAIPLTVVIKIGLEIHPDTQWAAKLLSQ
ncbi:AI-2E family transporter [Reinekea marina]|uniref:AI-2E family transporter n=1 Tax=Reinekea marina TaxID=1310421 RepID=A0ABV7WVV9_9GAMM|nr:AI-2E family transporter [Reinekea marina]MDN3648758.1 AI-2E family transporter [Reinekea marina]